MTDPEDSGDACVVPSLQEVGRLLEEYRPRLRRMLALRLDPRLGRRVESEDVLQDTFAETVQRLDEYRARQSMPFFLWVRLIALQRVAHLHRHHFGTARRDAGREVTPRGPAVSTATMAEAFAGTGSSPSHAAARGEILERVRSALDRLDEHDREVLALRYFEQLTLEETALALDMSASGVSKLQLRALGRLKRELPHLENLPTPS